MRIKVSVILPSYNVAEYIEQALKSVIAQTLQEIEIICVDAGSTDGTLESLESLANENSKIKIIHSDKKSYGYQMNLGIKEASGEYIGIVETDDFVDADMFETLYKRAIMYRADAVKGVLYEVYENQIGDMTEIVSDYIPTNYMSDIVLSPDEDTSVHDWDGNIWNGIYNREFLVKNNIWFQETPGAAFQDIAFQQMVLNEAKKVAYVHAHFYHYRKIRPGASTWNENCVRYIRDAYKMFLSDSRIKEKHRKHIYMRFTTAFLHELRKALCMSGYELDKIVCPEAVEWFIAEVKEALHSEIFCCDDFDSVIREDILLFLADIETYVKNWKEQAESMYALLEEVKCRLGDSKIVIFGLGNYGHMLFHFLIKNGIRVYGLVDNQKGMYNTSLFGLKILSPSDAVREDDAFFLIANKKAANDIKKQLLDLGVCEKNIMIFNGNNKALVKGLKKNISLPGRCEGDRLR